MCTDHRKIKVTQGKGKKVNNIQQLLIYQVRWDNELIVNSKKSTLLF
jgi:hypothetical protein